VPVRSLRSTIFGWWYITIGAGFLLLAVNRIIIGDALWQIALRFVISAGFFVLGYLELKSKLRR
jgi:hypothetical protein